MVVLYRAGEAAQDEPVSLTKGENDERIAQQRKKRFIRFWAAETPDLSRGRKPSLLLLT